jgi:hypothetical protein
MSWRVARSLDVLLGEINAAAPARNKASDGSIGDAAHASRDSDHNPWVIHGGQGIVRARDFTHDVAGGLDCHKLAKALTELIALGGHPALRSGAYVIWNGRIYSFDRRHEGWRDYSGPNPHTHHLHLSVAIDAAGFDSNRPWFVMTEEDPMADYEKQLNGMDRKLDRLLARDERFRKTAAQRHQKTLAALDEIAEQAKDDATRTQIRRLRDQLATETPESPESLAEEE